ncbi:hypothetical protein GCM10027075_49490 [Streptomyces heilongjiangensis]
MIRVSDLRALTAAMTAARDGTFVKTPQTGPAPAAERCTLFNRITDRSTHVGDEVQRVKKELVRHGRLDERLSAGPGQGAWATRVGDVNQTLDALVAPAANATRVLDAVARGDLTQRVDLHDGNRRLRGDSRRSGRVVNQMVDQLPLFTGEVTRVAREVGSEGQLGGQARVEGVYGTWKRQTTNVSELAPNPTTQVLAIAEVASAMAQGDMSRSITVEARGEVAELKDNINPMVANLRETTRAMDWLESNLARLAALMQRHRDVARPAGPVCPTSR